MAKLTVFFKFKVIDSYLFESGIFHIGRDESNNLTIDSLAVAPAHAALIIRDNVSTIKQLNDNFPLIINGQKTKECELKDNDTITLGKHDIIYNTTESVIESQINATSDFDKEYLKHDINDTHPQTQNASLQVLTGQNIGKVLSLKKAMTRLGSNGSGVIVIAKRKDGYFVSALENIGNITVNNAPIEDNYIKLNDNDILTISNVSLQFFLG